MPISREAFQIGFPDDQDDIVEESANELDSAKFPNVVDPSALIGIGTERSAAELEDGSGPHIIEEARANERPEDVREEDLHHLPPADTTSAGKKEAVGAAHLQREAHRSVTNGRDVPQFTPESKERERMEFNWDEARAQTEAFERRARTQKEAATDHLDRIHDIVGLLIEMSEAHSHDGERKLRSLEGKLAELETRFSINRSSQ